MSNRSPVAWFNARTGHGGFNFHMKKQILLADDDESVREMVGRVLESEGYEVVTASNGSQSIGRFLSHTPDLVLLDLTMPDRDGWEVFEVMRHFEPWVPIIIITARSQQQQRAMHSGIDALIEKPLDVPALLHTIGDLTTRPDARRPVGLPTTISK